VTALREHGNALVEQILAENEGRWESASERDLMRVDAIAKAVLNRLLHEPTIRLRSLSEERGHASLQLVRELFGLDTPQGGTPHSGAQASDSPRKDASTEDAEGKLAEVRSIQSARKG
jgi:hypothetical protein